MNRGNISLNHPERFKAEYKISNEKIQKSIKKATDKLLSKIDIYTDGFPGTYAKEFKYPIGENNSWTCGMHTGTFVLAYELTGDKRFLDVAENHMKTYKKRLDENINLDDHDVGFIYSPSCVALYKATGNELAKENALRAAEHLYNLSYSQKGGFIILGVNSVEKLGVRTIMDTLMNIQLFLWAYEQTADEKFLNAAKSQINVTDNTLIRPDGSSFHHYLFDKETLKPDHGFTFQGHSDDSCWSRGHAWSVYALVRAFDYVGDKHYLAMHHDVTNFSLNHLPEDGVTYWDYDFTSGDEARDSAAGLVTACGMMEVCRFLDDTDPHKEFYKNAAARIIDGTIDMCTDYESKDFDGLVSHVSCAVPYNLGVEGCASYGDFFYLEALMRYTHPDWRCYW